MLYAYILEDGEIVERLIVDSEINEEDYVNSTCVTFFDEEFGEMDVEKNGRLYTVSDVEMVFVSEMDTDDFEELFR